MQSVCIKYIYIDEEMIMMKEEEMKRKTYHPARIANGAIPNCDEMRQFTQYCYALKSVPNPKLV